MLNVALWVVLTVTPSHREVTLSEVIRNCVLADRRIRAALESVEQAKGQERTAGVLPNPGLSVSQTLMPFPRGDTDGPPQFDAGVSYALDGILFGKRSAAMSAARLDVEVATAAYANVVRQRVNEAIALFYDVLEAKAAVAIAKEDVEQLDRLQAITERRLALGSIGQIEVDRIRLAGISGRRRLLQSETALSNAQTALSARLGDGYAESDAVGTLELGSTPTQAPTLDAAVELAQANRPDYLAAAKQAQQSRASLRYEENVAWPTLQVLLGYTRQFPHINQTFAGSNLWGAGLAMSLPVFDRNQGNIMKLEATVRQADLLLEATRVELHAELEQALRSYDTAFKVVTMIDSQALASASDTRQRIEEAYKLGGRTLLELLDAQAAYREVFRDDVAARAEFLRSLHRLNAAIGKDILNDSNAL